MAKATTLAWRPLGIWPGEETTDRRRSAFKADRAQTLKLLAREAGMLGADRAIIQVDGRPAAFRMDRLVPNARIASPGVIVSLDSRHGPLRYVTDVFDWWEDNLRAIALGLEALRAVDRYGVARSGEQYRGWSALPAGTSRDVAKLFTTTDEARRFITSAAGREFSHLPLIEQYKLVRARSHPDAPEGDAEQWRRLQAAEKLLAGELKAAG